MGGNPTLEIYKEERSLFPYKRGPLPLDLEEGKRETIGLFYQKKVGDPNSPSLNIFLENKLRHGPI